VSSARDVLPEGNADTLRQRQLHASRSVTIHDVRCRPHDHAHGPEEWSTANQIVFPRTGLFVREAAGQQVLGDSNQVLFFSKHEAYRVAHPAGCGDDCTVFCYADDVLLEAFAAFDPRVQERPEQPFSFSHSPNQPELFLLHERLRQAAYGPDNDALAVDEAALTLLAGVVGNAYRLRGTGMARATPTARLHREQAQRTQLLLAARYAEDLTLDEIAHAVHCSPFHLARLFRRQTGLSVHQYRHRLRLAEALERVLAGEQNLSALALTLGFSSHAHLSDAFQRTFGIPPSACRNALSAARLRQMSRILKVEQPRRR
jgi:AraC family transcriptional regulator